MRLYNFLVNRHSGIRYRYHLVHDDAEGIKKIWSWIYLLLLNMGLYVFQIRKLAKLPYEAVYEKKKLLLKESESQHYLRNNPYLSVENYTKKLLSYDVISFDIFDTLIFRPFDAPTDLFYIVGEELKILNFAEIRIDAEKKLREESIRKNNNSEIALEDIWKFLNSKYGFDYELGLKTEISVERQLCYANPFMLDVFNRLIKQNKKIIIVSDMYLSSEVLNRILIQAGYSGYEKVYVSNEYKANKASGTLFDIVKSEYAGKSIIHVGDNPHSDFTMAKNRGIEALQYRNVNFIGKKYRPMDMSLLIGSAYRAMVNNHIYSGLDSFSMEYEYGYIYGGLFVLGYCQFIHNYVVKNNVDTVLFLARDGDILKQVYDIIYPDENTKYVYWSRKAATKLLAKNNRYDYYRRFLDYKINTNTTIEQALTSMEIAHLIDDKAVWSKLCGTLSKDDYLTKESVEYIKKFLDEKWSEVENVYNSQLKGAKIYFSEVLIESKKAVAVDIGWAGSGAMAISYLVEEVWSMPCTITGLIAGTNTIHNSEPNASESFLQSGKLVSYLYSQSFNRDLLKRHDPNKNFNVYWELLLSSPTKQFIGFDENGNLSFGKSDSNVEGIKEIQRGIIDFVTNYSECFKDYSYMREISGRDSYSPMLLAASNNEKYLKSFENNFSFIMGLD